MPMEERSDLITITEAAKLRGVQRQAIQSLIKTGKLKTYVVTVKQRRVRKSDVLAYTPERGRPPKKKKD